jgi:MFS family permease
LETLTRRLALSLGVLAAASFVSVAFSANAPLIQRSLQLSHTEVGAIASALYAGASVASIAGGRFTDRVGPGPVLVVSMLALAAGVVVAAVSPWAVVFFAGVVGCGFGYGGVNPPTNVLANPRAVGRRGLAMSAKQSGVPLGGIVASATLPRLAEVVGWRWAMTVPVAVCVLLAAASRRLRGRAQRSDEERPLPLAEGVVLRLSRGYGFGFLMAGVQVTIFAFLAVYLTDDRHLGADTAGTLLGVLLLGGLVGRPVWGWVSDRLHADRLRVLQGICLLSLVGLVLLPMLRVALLPAVFLLVGFSSVGWNGVYVAAVSEAARPELIGSATGAALLLINLGAVVVPPAFGALVGATGSWRAGWLLCAALSLLSLAVLQLSRTRRDATGPVAVKGGEADTGSH